MRVTRPKTRGALISFVDEDLEQIADALRDRSKGLKKWHAKLKAEYDGKKDGKKDSDSELKEPRTDEDYSDRDDTSKKDDCTSLVLKQRIRSRRPKGRSISTIIRMRRTRFRNQLPIFTDPEIFPIAKSDLEYDDLIYRVGDVVKLRAKTAKETPCYAQITGFYRDQFCGKYAALHWLCHSQPGKPLLNVMNDFDPSYFIQGQIHHKPVAMDRLIFVKRIDPALIQDNPHNQRMLLMRDGTKEYMDGVSSTISSLEGISRI